ncbi:MAG: hypothetical protein M0R20_01740 [Candidatus Omnitrophica bacterium]|jgi:Flp pilus assembly protein protease CpaA|nr:hypothetical protein [Candidatus Omnitrophota bacterium]
MLIYTYLLIAATGIITTYTDIKNGKIKNTHLIAILSIAIVIYGASITMGIFKLSLAIAVNLAVGLLLGFILYVLGTWKAGDAKLFFLYSFLLIPNKNSYALFLPCFTLFANIFLTSFLAILPLLIKDILYHKKDFFKYMTSKRSLITFAKTWVILFSLSFFVGPLILNYAPHDNTAAFFGFILFTYLIYRLVARTRYITLLISVLIIGVILKSLFMPEIISLQQIADFIKYTAGYSIITLILAYILSSEKNKYTRIPFAPFMLLGAALSTTKFLELVITALRNLR